MNIAVRTPESRLLFVGKASVLMVALTILSWPLTSELGVGSAVLCCLIAAALARWAQTAGLRTTAALISAICVLAFGFLASQLTRDSLMVATALGAPKTISTADAVLFGGIALSGIFTLRILALRFRGWSIVEAGVVVGAVAQLFARHRNLSINRPRFMADWALSHGYDPQLLLQAVGVSAAAFAIAMTLRRHRLQKLVISVAALLMICGLLFSWLKDIRPDIQRETLDPPGQANQSGGSGNKNSPPPVPVALALFHADHDPLDDLLYFRQRVFSYYDGRRLVIDPSEEFDRDIIEQFPSDADIGADIDHDPDFHLRVPTSMYLLDDHPQPLALSASIQISPRANPNPRRFVAAYDAISLSLATPIHRLVGRKSIPGSWSKEKIEHYTSHPDDPRYAALADMLTRETDLRFDGDDITRAFAIKAYLEKEGFYTRKERHTGLDDPTASFLFGNLRGYCVHFAHSAAHLLRTQGIASRVAVGYMVDNRLRGPGSAVVITSERAHAWPEIHVNGVGWIPFDIYPERSDEPPAQFVDQSLESLLGELARNDRTGGVTESPEAYALVIPWSAIGRWLATLIWLLVTLGYIIKVSRQLTPLFKPAAHRHQFTAVLDRFADIGVWRQIGESRERYATRLAATTPSLNQLTTTHLRLALGRPTHDDPGTLAQLCKRVLSEYDANLPRWRRLLGWINPWGWWFTR